MVIFQVKINEKNNPLFNNPNNAIKLQFFFTQRKIIQSNELTAIVDAKLSKVNAGKIIFQ